MDTQIEELMNRVDAAKTADELASLQLEVQTIYQRLAEPERAVFVATFAERVRSRGQRIADTLTEMEHAKASA